MVTGVHPSLVLYLDSVGHGLAEYYSVPLQVTVLHREEHSYALNRLIRINRLRSGRDLNSQCSGMGLLFSEIAHKYCDLNVSRSSEKC
jgi:hypothetical protein